MAGKYDDFILRAGLVKPDLLEKTYKIRVCKDRTLSVTEGGERPFNGVAIAVYSTNTRREADDLVLMLGSLQYGLHPSIDASRQMPYGQWRKVSLTSEPFRQELDYEHLMEVQGKVHLAALMIHARRAESAA